MPTLSLESVYSSFSQSSLVSFGLPLMPFFNQNRQSKTPIFQSKQPMTKKHYISLNSQFTVVLNIIVCFSVRFCENSLLMLKMRFQVFSFARKKVQGFSSDTKILMSLLLVLFHLQNCVSVFRNFNF